MKIEIDFIKKYIKNDIKIDNLITNLTNIGFESFLEENNIINISIPTNRNNCSIENILNELSKFYEIEDINNNDIIKISIKNKIKLEIKEKLFCPFYSFIYIENINNEIETPKEIISLLNINDIKLNNFIVDILNYSTLITGQPLHAYDKKTILNKIILKKTNIKKKFKTINEITINIKKNNHIICNSKNEILSIPGIIGSKDSKINKNTKNLILESAYFNEELIEKNEKILNTKTNASNIFKNGINHKNIIKSLIYTVKLIEKYQNIKCSNIIIKKNVKYLPKCKKITLKKSYISNFTNLEIKELDLNKIFKNIDVKIKKNNNSWQFKIPSYRKDLIIKENIIGEIIKFYGYDKIKEVPLKKYTDFIKKNYYDEKIKEKEIINFLISLGFQEIITYTFVDKNIEKYIISEEKIIEIKNPMSENNNVLRSNLLQGLIKTLKLNINKNNEKIKLFELGNVYYLKNKKIKTEIFLSLIFIENNLYDKDYNKYENEEFFKIKNLIENIYKRIKNIKNINFNNENLASYLDKNISTNILINKKKVGEFGLLNKNFTDKFSLDNNIYFANLIIKNLSRNNFLKFEILSKYPKIKRDISLIIDKNIIFSKIEESIKKLKISNLKEINFVSIYKIENKKSLSIRLTFQSFKKTLKDKEINLKINLIINHIKKEFNADFKI